MDEEVHPQGPAEEIIAMDRRLRAMIVALGPSMTEHTAEVCLRATALCRRKPVEMLSAEDLPAIEDSVRNALSAVASDASIELTLYKIRQLFLQSRNGADC
jgi:hypothetical protein